jgi:hypothetical protein
LAAPENGKDPLVLDALAMGDLVHRTLDLALRALEAKSGLSASAPDVFAAVEGIGPRRRWESERAIAAHDLAPHAGETLI